MFKQRCFRLLLLASAIATSLSAAAYDFESAGIYYNITGNNTVEVTYSDRDNNTYSGSISVPETVTNNGTEYSVTKIGEYAFQGSAVTSVSMPECITSMGQYAFSGCQNLETVALPESLTALGSNAFYSCKLLKTIKIPSNVTAIPGNCFNGCSSLESVTIPAGVMTIGDGAFYACSINALTLPESLEAIGRSAFSCNYSLKSVDIPAKVKTIEWSAFSSCGLTNLVIQEGVQTIDNYAFNSNSLQNLTLPSTITSIGGGAFCNNNLKSIICNAATPPTLGDDAFYGCNIQEVKVPLSSIAAYRQANGWKNFSNYCSGEVVNNGITYRIDENGATITAAEAALTEANIPSSVEFEGNQYAVTKINGSVFYGRSQLKALTLPESLIEIGNEAFSGCGLTDLVVPEGVQTIGSHAFYRNSLKKLILPSTITSIGNEAFRNNDNLQSIICNAATPPALGDNAFRSNISIKVPMASIAAYRKAYGWKDFSNYYGGEVVADGITYRINEKEAMVTAAEPSLIEANILSAVEFEGNQYPVIKINDKVFSGNTNLTVVTLSEGLVEIGEYAFSGCQNLESVTLPESLTTLGSNAFSSCKLLKAVKIPSRVTAIPGGCFNGCSSLESVTIPEGVTDIGGAAFSGCNLKALTLPESLEKIKGRAFEDNRSLKSVNIPAKVKTIETQAFYGCGLTDLVIPEGVQTIGSHAFFNNSLQNLTLPSTITSIGNSAFRYNYNLQSITCNAVTPPTLGDDAFYGSNIQEVKVPLASIAAYRKVYGWKDFSNYYGGEEIIDGVAYRIDDKGAYVQAAIMTESEICLAENVAFEGAQYPLYKIADNAFAGNGSITLVTVPATVETIGSNAFDGVTYPIIKIKATTPPVLASKLPMLSAIVPPASVKAYKAANYWKDMTIIGEGKNDIEVTTSATVDLTEAIMTQAKITPASVTSIKVHGPLTNDDIINALNTNMRSCYAIDLSDAEIEALPDEAFNGKIGLLEITLPAGLKAIGNNAFNGCFALRNEVTIPAGVETIGSNAFKGCKNAKFNPALPETLTAIGDYAFQNCANLYAVTLPASLQTIGDHAFEASNARHW